MTQTRTSILRFPRFYLERKHKRSSISGLTINAFSNFINAIFTWDYQCSSKCFSGVISFLHSIDDVLYEEFPGDDYRIIAPYMQDLITEDCDGRIYYRQATNGSLLTMASNHVRQCNSGQSGFSATWVFVATGDRLTHFEGNEATPVSVNNMTTKFNA